MLERIDVIAKKYNVMFGIFGHAGDGNLHPTCLTDERDKDEIQRAEAAFEEIFYESIKLGGTITRASTVQVYQRKNSLWLWLVFPPSK